MARNLKPTPAEVGVALDVLQSHYQAEFVDDIIDTLVREIFDREIEGDNNLHERAQEEAERATQGRREEKLVLFCSESVSQAAEEARDFSDAPDSDLIATIALRIDVVDALDNIGLGHGWERESWIKEVIDGDHGDALSVLWDQHVARGGEGLEEPDEDEEDEEDEEAEPNGLPWTDEVINSRASAHLFLPTADELRDLPVISQGQTGNLMIDTGQTRVWLERVGVEDGMPHDDGVVIETLQGGRWVVIAEYGG